jgi:hypothetical protein
MEPKRLYSISWTQPYPQYDLLAELAKLQEELIEMCIDDGDFKEADEVIARVKQL